MIDRSTSPETVAGLADAVEGRSVEGERSDGVRPPDVAMPTGVGLAAVEGDLLSGSGPSLFAESTATLPEPAVSAGAVPAAGDAPAATLNKSVFALAIEPLTMALTVTGRKAYDVMLWIAQRSRAGAEGGYTSPVSAILRGYGSTTKASERVQRYIEQMVQTTVVWRPLSSAPSQPSLLPDDDAGSSGAGVRSASGEEVRTFPLLAEARLYVRGGEAWVTWFYPPSIREQLVNPERWAQLELSSIAKLTTYTAVALYEICARYKDSPGGLTSRHEPEFWSRVLREGGGVKPREFRKFKSELLVPAIAEIGEKTEIEVELVEHRGATVLEEVQFRVRRRATMRSSDSAPEPADVGMVMHAARLGVKESEVDSLVGRHGAASVVAALDRLEVQLQARDGERIGSPGAYLRAMLASADVARPATPPAAARPVEARTVAAEEANPRGADGASVVSPSAATQTAPAEPSAGAARARRASVMTSRKIDAQQERRELVEAWVDAQWRAVHQQFAALPEADQRRWVDRVGADLTGTPLATPGIRRRLTDYQWESPLIRHLVLGAFAASSRGPTWREPSEIDLVMFGAQRSRAQNE